MEQCSLFLDLCVGSWCWLGDLRHWGRFAPGAYYWGADDEFCYTHTTILCFCHALSFPVPFSCFPPFPSSSFPSFSSLPPPYLFLSFKKFTSTFPRGTRFEEPFRSHLYCILLAYPDSSGVITVGHTSLLSHVNASINHWSLFSFCFSYLSFPSFLRED